MRNYKTTILGILTIIISASTVAKSLLEGSPVGDFAVHVAAITAGWGLISAKDDNARL
jgi:hypothetical protein